MQLHFSIAIDFCITPNSWATIRSNRESRLYLFICLHCPCLKNRGEWKEIAMWRWIPNQIIHQPFVQLRISSHLGRQYNIHPGLSKLTKSEKNELTLSRFNNIWANLVIATQSKRIPSRSDVHAVKIVKCVRIRTHIPTYLFDESEHWAGFSGVILACLACLITSTPSYWILLLASTRLKKTSILESGEEYKF